MEGCDDVADLYQHADEATTLKVDGVAGPPSQTVLSLLPAAS
jgi:hypothetical protein